MKSFAIQEIAQKLGGKIIGNPDLIITGPEQLEQAKESQITFIGSKKYVKFWQCSGYYEELDGVYCTNGERFVLSFLTVDQKRPHAIEDDPPLVQSKLLHDCCPQ